MSNIFFFDSRALMRAYPITALTLEDLAFVVSDNGLFLDIYRFLSRTTEPSSIYREFPTDNPSSYRWEMVIGFGKVWTATDNILAFKNQAQANLDLPNNLEYKSTEPIPFQSSFVAYTYGGYFFDLIGDYIISFPHVNNRILKIHKDTLALSEVYATLSPGIGHGSFADSTFLFYVNTSSTMYKINLSTGAETSGLAMPRDGLTNAAIAMNADRTIAYVAGVNGAGTNYTSLQKYTISTNRWATGVAFTNYASGGVPTACLPLLVNDTYLVYIIGSYIVSINAISGGTTASYFLTETWLTGPILWTDGTYIYAYGQLGVTYGYQYKLIKLNISNLSVVSAGYVRQMYTKPYTFSLGKNCLRISNNLVYKTSDTVEKVEILNNLETFTFGNNTCRLQLKVL